MAKFKIKPFVKLSHHNYPVGWGTGLNAKEWREFANKYIPSKKGYKKVSNDQ
jgi:hypothetical protein